MFGQPWLIESWEINDDLTEEVVVRPLPALLKQHPSSLALGVELAWIYCLLFGALISPTDPIAVLGILKSAGAPKGLEIKIG